MKWSIAIFVLITVCVAIWGFTELKRVRHKIFAVVLLSILIFLFFSISYVFKVNSVDFETIPGTINATKIYFSWLGSILVNMKEITVNAIKLDWGINNQSNKGV